MGEIKTQCNHCGKRYLVDDEFLGEEARCELCGRQFSIIPMPIKLRPHKGPDEAEHRTTPLQAVLVSERMKNNEAELSVPELTVPFVRIEPGTFRMGTDDGLASEQPAHTVRLTRPYWLARCLVTQAEYGKIMHHNPSYYLGAGRPVEVVSWFEAKEFCDRLTARHRRTGSLDSSAEFRLPTEAEWEYACCTVPPDGGADEDLRETTPYCFGDDAALLDEYGWFDANSDGISHSVGEKKSSPRGLLDLHGNVGEWCMDWFGPYPPLDTVDPPGPPDGKRKARRGGSWSACAARCRGTDRIGVSPHTRCAIIGFRVALAFVALT